MNWINSLKYMVFIAIGIIMTGCIYKPVSLIVKYQTLDIQHKFEFNIIKSRIITDKVYFTLSVKNISENDRILLIHSGPLTLTDIDSNIYSVHLDEFLGQEKSLEVCLVANEKVELKLYSPISFMDKKEKYYLYIKNNITSKVPICFKKYIDRIKSIKNVKVRSTGTDSFDNMIYIGYIIECSNKKKFYLKSLLNNKIIIRDIEKKKQVLEFDKDDIDEYLNKICTY